MNRRDFLKSLLGFILAPLGLKNKIGWYSKPAVGRLNYSSIHKVEKIEADTWTRVPKMGYVKHLDYLPELNILQADNGKGEVWVSEDMGATWTLK